MKKKIVLLVIEAVVIVVIITGGFGWHNYGLDADYYYSQGLPKEYRLRGNSSPDEVYWNDRYLCSVEIFEKDYLKKVDSICFITDVVEDEKMGPMSYSEFQEKLNQLELNLNEMRHKDLSDAYGIGRFLIAAFDVLLGLGCLLYLFIIFVNESKSRRLIIILIWLTDISLIVTGSAGWHNFGTDIDFYYLRGLPKEYALYEKSYSDVYWNDRISCYCYKDNNNIDSSSYYISYVKAKKGIGLIKHQQFLQEIEGLGLKVKDLNHVDAYSDTFSTLYYIRYFIAFLETFFLWCCPIWLMVIWSKDSDAKKKNATHD